MNYLPVPQRHEGNGLTISAPSFNLPPEITNEKLIKKFIAEKYGVLPSMVLKLGESYFNHVGMTPHRIYPYAVSIPPGTLKDPDTHFIPFYQMMLLQRLISKEPHFMLAIARAYQYFHEEIRLDAQKRVNTILKQRFEGLQPDWSIPLNYESLDVLKQESANKLKEKMEADKQGRLMEVKKDTLSAQKKAAFQPAPQPQQAAPTSKERPAPDYAAEEMDSEEVKEFEDELEAFMDTVENDIEPTPRPEKW